MFNWITSFFFSVGRATCFSFCLPYLFKGLVLVIMAFCMLLVMKACLLFFSFRRVFILLFVISLNYFFWFSSIFLELSPNKFPCFFSTAQKMKFIIKNLFSKYD